MAQFTNSAGRPNFNPMITFNSKKEMISEKLVLLFMLAMQKEGSEPQKETAQITISMDKQVKNQTWRSGKKASEREEKIMLHVPITLPDFIPSQLNAKMEVNMFNFAKVYEKFTIDEGEKTPHKEEEEKIKIRVHRDRDPLVVMSLTRKFSKIPGLYKISKEQVEIYKKTWKNYRDYTIYLISNFDKESKLR
jgi:hypothetical protein